MRTPAGSARAEEIVLAQHHAGLAQDRVGDAGVEIQVRQQEISADSYSNNVKLLISKKWNLKR